MKKIKVLLVYGIILFLGIGSVFAYNYGTDKKGDNWDANVLDTDPANDVFTLSGRLDLEDSRTSAYQTGYRGKITGIINSKLFGGFIIKDKFDLNYKKKYEPGDECGDGKKPYSIFSMSGTMNSSFWGDLIIDSTGSYFCSNEYVYIKFKSPSLGEKEFGNTNQVGLRDDFDKQQVYVQGIINSTGDTGEGLLAKGYHNIRQLEVYRGDNAIIKRDINKNIYDIYNTYKDKRATDNPIDNFNNTTGKEKYYVYDYKLQTEDIELDGSTYKNKGKILKIEDSSSDNIVKVNGINTVIVDGGNIYIKSDIDNGDDKKDLLILVAKREKQSGNGGNIYIDPSVTNIDAILIADGSLISLKGEYIQKVDVSSQITILRKQLLIYGKVMSSNNLGTDNIPYGADLYKQSIMSNSIYDFGNLRTFNLNYGGSDNTNPDECLNSKNLTPIDTGIKSIAGRKRCYLTDSSNNNLRGTEMGNPVVIENNVNVNYLKPFILTNR